ncbi:MAG: glycoside hydrolase family 2 protein [Bryobacteraceae bacterium]
MSAVLLKEAPFRGEVADPGAPRPEYPQPQFEREDWKNLNGIWDFEFDDRDEGLGEKWATEDRQFSRNIVVPFCFESPASGIGDPGDHPHVWYRRQFEIPEHWQGRRILLHFGAVDYRATVWINGSLSGEHEGGHTPFRFDITSSIRPGQNTVTVRVEDPPADRYIPRGKQHWQNKSESIFYSRTTGIWQTVWLEPVGDSYLDRVRIEANQDGVVTFDARVLHASGDMQFIATVRQEGRFVATSMAEVVGSQASGAASVRDPQWWSPDSPSLYEITFELLKDERPVDRVHSYFGFRSVSVQSGKVVLNGAPIYLKMVLDQGYWPDTNLTPPSDEAIRYDIQMAKDMGFNGVRKHQKIEDPRFLYWADRMGLLVSAEMANSYMFDDESVSRLTREWIDAITRDYNHPSIVVWVPVNESWGIPNVQDRRQLAHLKAMYMLTRSLDVTRLIIDNDGWEHTDVTDLFAIHDYSHDGTQFYERFKSIEEGRIPAPFQGKMFLAPGYEYNGSPIFLSEFGGVSYAAPDSMPVPEDSWGYEGVEATEGGTLTRIRSLYEAIAKLPKVVGICYTQLTDVEQEINGLMTYDRKPKFDIREIRALNALLH